MCYNAACAIAGESMHPAIAWRRHELNTPHTDAICEHALYWRLFDTNGRW
jgi:hypothetical protein